MSEKTSEKSWPVRIVNGVLILCGLVMVLAGVLYAVAAQTTSAATCLTGGVILLLFGTVDRFESIKGLGIEAKVRKLDATINVAEDMLKRLREVTEMFGAATMRTAAMLGRYDSALSVEDGYALSRQMHDQLSRLGSSPAAVRGMLDPWVKMTALDCFQHVIADYWKVFDGHKTDIGSANMHAGAAADPAMVGRFNQMNDWKNTVQGRIQDKAPLEAWQEICAEPERWPFLPEAARTALQAKIATWDPEVRYLLERADLRTPSMWFRIR